VTERHHQKATTAGKEKEPEEENVSLEITPQMRAVGAATLDELGESVSQEELAAAVYIAMAVSASLMASAWKPRKVATTAPVHALSARATNATINKRRRNDGS